MSLQACLFDINDWSTEEVRKFLKIHNITPIKKVHKTKHFYVIESFNQIIINMFIVLKLYRNHH